MTITRRDFIMTSACAAVAAVSTTTQHTAVRPYQLGAYYFPNFHVDPRNETVHGKGWTEWEILKRGEPKFTDHHQPKKPLWGTEDEADPKVFQKR